MEQPGSTRREQPGYFTPENLHGASADTDAMAARVLTGKLASGALDPPESSADALPRCNVGHESVGDCNFLLYQAGVWGASPRISHRPRPPLNFSRVCTTFIHIRLAVPCLAVATSAEHVRLAREVASASVVLLKNDNDVLPIQRGARVALIGAACDAAFLNANEGRWDAADYYAIGGSARVLSDPAAAMSITRALTERHANSDFGGLTVLPLDDVQVALDGMRGHDIAIVVRDCVAIH